MTNILSSWSDESFYKFCFIGFNRLVKLRLREVKQVFSHVSLRLSILFICY